MCLSKPTTEGEKVLQHLIGRAEVLNHLGMEPLFGRKVNGSDVGGGW